MLCLTLQAQKTDTLPEVKLRMQKGADIATAPMNTQELNKATLNALSSISVADAAKYFSGVVIKDYGGVGGLKTISVRSLGTNYTVFLYDGIAISDAQGGQIDLGRFSLENVENVMLFANNPSDVLSTARSFSGASVLSLSTSSAKTKEKSLLLKMNLGSFGFINPVVAWKSAIGKHITHSIFGQYQYANGAYPFKDYETGTKSVKRINSDITTYHAEYDAAYAINDSNSIKLKAYYYNSKRGLPGSIIYFNNYSSERLNNESFFAQLAWRKTFSKKASAFLSGKYSSDYKYYLDPSYQNSAGKLENEFHQKEYYTSAVVSYHFFGPWSASLATDFFYSKLIRTDRFAVNFANPSRNNLLGNFLLQYKTKSFEISGNLLFTSIVEMVEKGNTGQNYQKFTPAIAASLQPFKTLPLRVRASYKQIFRAPTFDDLYYTNVGNTNLKPEFAKQYSVGITAGLHPQKIFEEIILTVDAYYNDAKDKILAVPRQNLFQWTMLNVGKASIKGIDVSGTVHYKALGALQISSRFSYTFQQAQDVTLLASIHQLPYAPEHAGSFNLFIKYKALDFSYNILMSSYKYGIGQTQDAFIQGWPTHDISLAYNFKITNAGDWQLLASLNNIFNKQYQIIKFYPMPGISYRLGLSVKF